MRPPMSSSSTTTTTTPKNNNKHRNTCSTRASPPFQPRRRSSGSRLAPAARRGAGVSCAPRRWPAKPRLRFWWRRCGSLKTSPVFVSCQRTTSWCWSGAAGRLCSCWGSHKTGWTLRPRKLWSPACCSGSSRGYRTGRATDRTARAGGQPGSLSWRSKLSKLSWRSAGV